MANGPKIEVQLLADLKLALDKLGLGNDIEKALGSQPGLVNALAKGIGLDIQKAIASSVASGMEQGVTRAEQNIKNKIGRIQGLLGTPLNYKDFIEKSLGPRPVNPRGQSYYNNIFGPVLPQRAASVPHLATMLNQQLGIGAGQNRPDRKAYEDFWSSTVPPFAVKQPSNIFASLEQKLLGGAGHGSGLLGGFGRYEIGHGFLQSIGIGGGGMGRIGGAALAGFGGKLPGLTIALATLTVAIDATKAAFQKLIQAAEEGAKLYQQGRSLGVGSQQASAFIKILGAVGIDESAALRLAANGQFRTGGAGLRGAVSGMSVASGMRAGLSQLEIQQLANMGQEIKFAATQLQGAIRQTANAAKENFNTTVQWLIFKEDFEAFWQQASAIMGNALQTLIVDLDTLLKGINLIGEAIVKLRQNIPEIFHVIAGSMAPFLSFMTAPIARETAAHRVGGFARDTHFGSLERMGLVIGGGHDRVFTVLQKIEQNTRPRNGGFGGHGSGSSWDGPQPQRETFMDRLARDMMAMANAPMVNIP